jgi:hypothetical protein
MNVVYYNLFIVLVEEEQNKQVTLYKMRILFGCYFAFKYNDTGRALYKAWILHAF